MCIQQIFLSAYHVLKRVLNIMEHENGSDKAFGLKSLTLGMPVITM